MVKSSGDKENVEIKEPSKRGRKPKEVDSEP